MNMFSCPNGLSVLRRKSFLAATTLAFFISPIMSPTAFAANRYWAGSVNGNDTRFESLKNWSATARGATGATVPGVNDVAIFLGSGSTVVLRSRWTGSGIVLGSTWTGSLLMGTGAIKISPNGRTGIRIGSGFLIGGFTGSGIEIASSGSGYTQTGGVVSLAGPLMLSGSFKVQSTTTKRVSFTSTGTLTLNGSSNQFFTNGQGGTRTNGKYLGSITVRNSGASNTTNKVIVSGSTLGLSGALTITTGTLDLTTNSVPLIAEDGNITIANAALAGLTTASDVTHSGALTVGYNAAFGLTGGTWTIMDDSSTTYTLNGPFHKFNALTITNTGGSSNRTVLWAGSGANLSGALVINTGILDLGTNSQVAVIDDGNITVADSSAAGLLMNSNVIHSGSLTVGTAGAFAMRGGTWTVIDDSDTTYTMNGGSKHFYNLTLNNTAGTSLDDLIIAGTDLSVSGSLTVTSGKLDLTTNGLTATMGSGVTIADSAAAILTAGNLFVGGNWTKHALGTYTHNGGTVNFNGGAGTTQTLTGSTTFYNFSATTTAPRSLAFPAGLTQTITNSLSLNGVTDNKLTLASAGATDWKLVSSGTRFLSFLTVSRSNNLGVTIPCGNNCTDGGNNTAWDFTSTTGGGSTGGGSTGGSGGGGGGGGGRSYLGSTPSKKPVTPTVNVTPKAVITNKMTPKERLEARKAARIAAAAAREARKSARKAKWGIK